MFDPAGPTLLELARQALSSTERGYDLIAETFDRTPFRTPEAMLAPVARAIEADHGPRRDLLDLMCGTGAASRALKPLFETATGVDLSAGMLAVAVREVERAPGRARFEPVRRQALELGFERAFDVAVSFGAMGHILPADHDRLFGALARALRPGGRLWIASHVMPRLGSPRWLAARGFNAVMRVRNALIAPPFLMYYLTFPLERAAEVLSRHGFDLRVSAPWSEVPGCELLRLVRAELRVDRDRPGS